MSDSFDYFSATEDEIQERAESGDEQAKEILAFRAQVGDLMKGVPELHKIDLTKTFQAVELSDAEVEDAESLLRQMGH